MLTHTETYTYSVKVVYYIIISIIYIKLYRTYAVRRQSILDKERKKIRCAFGLCFVDIKQPFVVGTTAF